MRPMSQQADFLHVVPKGKKEEVLFVDLSGFLSLAGDQFVDLLGDNCRIGLFNFLLAVSSLDKLLKGSVIRGVSWSWPSVIFY